MNIYEKLLCITDELQTVAKNLSVGTGRSSYKAVGEADILNAVKPLEKKYGVYSYPIKREVVSQDILTTEKEYNGKLQTSTKFMMRVETTYRFVNIAEPNEFVDQVSYGDGVDSLDKAPGKAMTYSDKYSLMKAYKIMTGDDPDQKHSNETPVSVTRQARRTEQQKENIVNLIQEGKIDFDKVKAYYQINGLDDVTYDQAIAIIKKGNTK